MIEYRDNCICYDIPCTDCGRRHEKTYVCDYCLEDTETLYQIDDEQFCEDCFKKNFRFLS